MNHKFKILFLTDFSENSESAFDYALKVAGRNPSIVDVLHVVIPEIEAADVPIMSGRMTVHKSEVAHSLIDTFSNSGMDRLSQKEKANITLHRHVEIGSLIAIVLNSIKDNDYDIVILGTRGEGKTIFDKWLGSVSTRVLNESPVPVLLVPSGNVFAGIHSMVFASDKRDSDPFLIWKATRLFNPDIKDVKWVHVEGDKKKDQNRNDDIAHYFSDMKWPVNISFHNVSGSDFSSSVEQFLHENNSDLLVMVKYPKGFFEKLFSSSKTSKLSTSTQTPLLIIKENS